MVTLIFLLKCPTPDVHVGYVKTKFEHTYHDILLSEEYVRILKYFVLAHIADFDTSKMQTMHQ